MLQEPVYFRFVKEETEFRFLFDFIKANLSKTLKENTTKNYNGNAQTWADYLVNKNSFDEEYYWPAVILLPFKDHLKPLLTKEVELDDTTDIVINDDLNFIASPCSNKSDQDLEKNKKPQKSSKKAKKNILIWLFGTNKYITTSTNFLSDFETVDYQKLYKNLSASNTNIHIPVAAANLEEGFQERKIFYKKS